MNFSEYQSLIEQMCARLARCARSAAYRNSSKDYNRHLDEYEKGWENFDLANTLEEETVEVVGNPTNEHELGDVAWVIAMMLDQKVEEES